MSAGDGYITTAVLREILAALDDKLTPDDLDGIIEEIDEDGSGTIDFDGEYHFSRLKSRYFMQIELGWLFKSKSLSVRNFLPDLSTDEN